MATLVLLQAKEIDDADEIEFQRPFYGPCKNDRTYALEAINSNRTNCTKPLEIVNGHLAHIRK
jgi:hypothetical protein